MPFRQTARPLPPGSTLALYIDGLVERPGTDIEAQIDVLARTLDVEPRGAPADPQRLDRAAGRLMRTFIPDTVAHDDDATLLLVGLPDQDGGGACG
ncbi:hypothetical protein GCM10010339_91240 [Streptomyces alanosinicus]|uniref:PPM-type phosphatase domain-containing protein n=1 Tax=Streptomyces alanosinicus TaxID=68171 RepID=A0A918YTT4_9ACTN|nr:hypothetical protein GCM10010339_91240 [Streptomyces alanosinicus]